MDVSHALRIVRLTDTGKCREHNEDAVASDAEIGLLVLADGMGGYQAGEVASEIAVLTIVAELKQSMLVHDSGPLAEGNSDPLLTSMPLSGAAAHPGNAPGGMQAERQLLLEVVAKANANIFNVSQTQAQCAGMGTTLVVAMFSNNKLLAGHIGDSRMYRFRAGQLVQLTQDHSALQEQINLGLITPQHAKWSESRNLLTRALGVAASVELELHEHEVMVDDLYLLCSDGLTDEVDDYAIQAVLGELHALHADVHVTGLPAREDASGRKSLHMAAQQLIAMANAHGGKDNISVVLAYISQPYSAKQAWYRNMLPWLIK